MSISARRVSSSSSQSIPFSLPPAPKTRRRISSIRQKSDGFDFDPLLKNKNKSVEKEPFETEEDRDNANRRIKEAGQLASVFLEVRKGIMSDNNVDVSINEQRAEDVNKSNNKQVKKSTNISKASLHRAEKVKMMLNLYYYAITETQKPINKKYVGVDGVYNPLQIIRNRKIRKTYGDVPTISVKTLPAASTVFSKKTDKLLWEVGVTELVYDATWRNQHWYELVNPEGQLWFPDSSKNSHHNHQHHYHRPHFRHHADDEEVENIHQKLFEEESSDSDKEPVIELTPVQSNEDVLEIPRTRTRKRDLITSRIRSKSPFKRLNPSTPELSPYKEQLNVTIEELPEPSTKPILNEITVEPIRRNVSSDLLTPFDSSDSPFEEKEHSESPIGVIEENVDLNENLNDEDYQELKLLNRYLNDLRYLNNVVKFSQHDYVLKLDAYNNSLNFDKFENIYKEISTKSNQLSSEILVDYSRTLNTEIKELNTVQNELINDYSTRVDKLLTLSDRTIGEVNTTLSLEIRKLTERFEKTSNYSIHKKTDSLLNFGYWLLENLVVLILWSIWIGFSIGRFVKYVVVFLWKVLKWLLK